MQGIKSWSINSSKMEQNNGKTNIVCLSSSEHEQDKEQLAEKSSCQKTGTYGKLKGNF